MAPTRPSKERAQCGACVFLVVGCLVLAALLSFELFVIRASDHGAAVEHLASSEEFARGTNAHVDFERPVAAAPGIGAGGSPSLSTAQQQRLAALGFSTHQVAAMGSMTEAQVAAEILKAVESAETPATVAAAVSAPAATAAVATEESPLDAAYAAIAATAEEVRARNSLTTVPFPGELNAELIRTLRPPPFCFTAVNGEPAEPCVSKFKQAPSDKVAMKIAQLVAEERPCWIYNRKCARMNLTDTTGKPFWQKFNKTEDQTLEDLWPNIPDHADGSLGTCAIVGNADNLSGKGWGTQIDAHDFVVRYNVEIKGFEKDVGTKRNGIWTKINYERAAPGKEPTEYHMIPKFVPKGLEPIRGKPIMVYGPALPRWREVARDVYAVYKADRKITKGSPTGGWARMVSLAESGLCSRLDIYGFSSGGGKYFKRTQVVKEAHVIQVEHYTRRLMMALGVKGKVCVYGQ